MNKLAHKLHNLALRKNRVRSTIFGTATRPRLSVHISNRHITAQLIDDDAHKTLVYISTVGKKAAAGTLTERATWVGAEVAKKAKTAKITAVVFDRNGRIYHGRVKALADAARNAGLEF
ncbi:MAG TPA: 50S ribosomal protein L18 [Candidatus Saccharimonadales bacterium]|nr:50S ribosomal protein L18 [Candidatus Saccharimonadales bacterium]